MNAGRLNRNAMAWSPMRDHIASRFLYQIYYPHPTSDVFFRNTRRRIADGHVG